MVNPSVGKFKKPNLLAGLGFSYSYDYQKTNNDNNDEISRTNTHSFGVNIYAQRFFTWQKNSFSPLMIMLLLVIVSEKFFQRLAMRKTKRIQMDMAPASILRPGLSYQLTNRLLFDAYLSNLISISYSHNQKKYADSSPEHKSYENYFGLSSSLTNTNLGYVGLGFRWLLKK